MGMFILLNYRKAEVKAVWDCLEPQSPIGVTSAPLHTTTLPSYEAKSQPMSGQHEIFTSNLILRLSYALMPTSNDLLGFLV